MAIHQEIIFESNVNQIYQLLTDSKFFSHFSGAPADINAVIGGQFTAFGGMITGVTIEVEPGRRLVQAWRAGNWAPGDYSVTKFELESISDAETRLIFDQTGHPKEFEEHLAQGWHERYWSPIEEYLKEQR